MLWDTATGPSLWDGCRSNRIGGTNQEEAAIQQMNPHARWRLEFAHSLSSRLRHYAGIDAIVVAGSVARGYTDAYSDLELILYWAKAPGLDLQEAIVADLKAGHRYPAIDPGHQSALVVDGFPVDLWHKTAAEHGAVIDTVLKEHSIDLHASNVMDTIRTCIPLFGAEVVQPLKERAAAYPEELAVRFLQTYLPHFHLRQLNLAAHRENPTAYYSILSAIQSSLFLSLLALNQSYFPTFKWIYPRLAELPRLPQQAGARLRQILSDEPLRAAAQLRTLLTETLGMVEAAYPHLDTAYPRYGLDQEARAYTEVPGRS
jgi:hypothetical protein